MRNPQMFKQFQNLQRNQNDPQKLLNEMMGKYTPEQKKQFIQFANNFGVNEEQLNKYGINSK